ncbi:MAG: hypothetical protein IPM82_02580 [Saprospiraceae bacterium]|nr:hypothetical protein [Saprospiraceae bacterium]
MRKPISSATKKWLASKDYQAFADYFIGICLDEKDKLRRESSIEIAAIWCQLGEKDEDGKEIHPSLEKRILALQPPISTEDIEPIQNVWLTCVPAWLHTDLQKLMNSCSPQRFMVLTDSSCQIRGDRPF